MNETTSIVAIDVCVCKRYKKKQHDEKLDVRNKLEKLANVINVRNLDFEHVHRVLYFLCGVVKSDYDALLKRNCEAKQTEKQIHSYFDSLSVNQWA